MADPTDPAARLAEIEAQLPDMRNLNTKEDYEYLLSLVRQKDKEIERLRALAYDYPPSEPFASDGQTWKQRAETAESKLSRALAPPSEGEIDQAATAVAHRAGYSDAEIERIKAQSPLSSATHWFHFQDHAHAAIAEFMKRRGAT